jgi:hypothetical protein
VTVAGISTRSVHRSSLLLLGYVSALLAGCGGPSNTTPARPTSPFTETDLRLFDDGVDLVSDPDGLGGKWADDWNVDMRDRVSRSDLIALVTVNTLLSDTDPEGHVAHRLVVQVGTTMKGKPPADEINLSSLDSAIGFPTVDSNKGRLLHMRLLALLKWYEQPDGSVDSHFHLVADADTIVSRVQAHIERDSPQDRTINQRRFDSSKGEQ